MIHDLYTYIVSIIAVKLSETIMLFCIFLHLSHYVTMNRRLSDSETQKQMSKGKLGLSERVRLSNRGKTIEKAAGQSCNDKQEVRSKRQLALVVAMPN